MVVPLKESGTKVGQSEAQKLGDDQRSTFNDPPRLPQYGDMDISVIDVVLY